MIGTKGGEWCASENWKHMKQTKTHGTKRVFFLLLFTTAVSFIVLGWIPHILFRTWKNPPRGDGDPTFITSQRLRSEGCEMPGAAVGASRLSFH